MQSDLKALEFDGVRRLLEKLTSSPYGADAARALEPAPDLDSARRFQASVSIARRLVDAAQLPPLDDIPDITAALRQAGTVGSALNPTALHHVRQVIQVSEALTPWVQDNPALCPAGAQALIGPPALAELLARTLAETGRLREDATDELERLHLERHRHTQEAADTVRHRMRQADLKVHLEQSDKVKWHNERAVIGLNRELADSVKGVRRGTAMGGRDVLVEPIEAVAANNRIETVAGQISAAQQKLLREVTNVVREHLPALQAIVGALTWVDLAMAGGHLSAHLNGHAPQLVETTGVELREAYHPLLLLQFAEGTGPRPVPLNIRLDTEDRLLVITGPNTGGKTVVLKTLGLLCSMAHCGLHIPAEGDCTIGCYSRVMVDVGDHQSLFHHLSTFAGHVEVLKRILAEADENTLVLLDELGTGTDPEEGAALAMSVMDELVERGVQGIVNTHLSPLKDYAAERKHVVNASMRFDHEQLKPTYQLQIGVPGESLGLIVAEKSGLPAELVRRAHEHLKRVSRRSP